MPKPGDFNGQPRFWETFQPPTQTPASPLKVSQATYGKADSGDHCLAARCERPESPKNHKNPSYGMDYSSMIPFESVWPVLPSTCFLLFSMCFFHIFAFGGQINVLSTAVFIWIGRHCRTRSFISTLYASIWFYSWHVPSSIKRTPTICSFYKYPRPNHSPLYWTIS